jgi:DNA-directed RNA polymerase subunit RPC12/RpoP
MGQRNWEGLKTLKSRSYVCGYCGQDISSEKGYSGGYIVQTPHKTKHLEYIYICHHCGRPTFFDHSTRQFPDSLYGGEVQNVPSEVYGLYNEARSCVSVNAFTASTMCSRKIIMNVAVERTAPTGITYQQYVDWLDSNGYLPQGSKDWVDHVRTTGNAANHEIPVTNEQDAKLLIDFVEMLLKLIYEFPGKIPGKTL